MSGATSEWLERLQEGDEVTTVDRAGVRRVGQVVALLAFGQIAVGDSRGVETYVHETGHMVPDVYGDNRPRIEPEATVEAMLDEPIEPPAADPNERLLAELGRLTAAVSMLAHEIKGLVEAREGDG